MVTGFRVRSDFKVVGVGFWWLGWLKGRRLGGEKNREEDG